MKAVNCTTGNTLADDVSIADTLFTRMKGLLGRSDLPSGKGLLIRPCKGVHTFCMQFPIDVIFLDKANRVISLAEGLQPNRMTKVLQGATSVIELPAGTLSTTNTSVGDEVVIA
ncbi:DUF192 domain-containing protein [Geobacter luticola]|uniref:DUF192 domain-containing protein n=2 Tax=Geomobilimonas luticola TaxID=1114878 RepID=A0ABS5SC72_9BACT|nr:DUF192 domain-containing protein [Geomobilimonas luticola]MBT0652957.1 DUF192 domain-containing protein [Geomobilimonas luticola]